MGINNVIIYAFTAL